MSNEINALLDAKLGELSRGDDPSLAYKNLADQLSKKENPVQPTPEPKVEKEPEPEVAVDSEEEVVDPEVTEESQEETVQEEDPRVALFNELRSRFPNESYEKIGKRVEAALGSQEPTEEAPVGDALDAIGSEFQSYLQQAQEAQEALQKLEQDAEENGTILEFKGEFREAFERASQIKAEAKERYATLQLEALAQAEAEFPDLGKDRSAANLLFSSKLDSALRANPNFDAHDPTLVARIAREAAREAQELISAIPQPPKPAPARKPSSAPRVPTAGLPSNVQGAHATVGSNPNGPTPPPSLADIVRGSKSLNDAFQTVSAGGGSSGWIFS